MLEGERGEGTVAWDDVEGADPELRRRAALARARPDDLLTLIYTSGTTGPPKGVELTHRNLLCAVGTIDAVVQFPDESRVISWLPAAHIAERAAHHYLPIVYAMTVTCCPDPREIVSYLPQVKPTWFFAVPRIWEKLRAGHGGLRLRARAARTAPRLDAAMERVRLEQAGEPVPDDVAATAAEGEAEVRRGARDARARRGRRRQRRRRADAARR